MNKGLGLKGWGWGEVGGGGGGGGILEVVQMWSKISRFKVDQVYLSVSEQNKSIHLNYLVNV